MFTPDFCNASRNNYFRDFLRQMNVFGCHLEIKDFFRVMAVGSHKGFQCLHVCFWIPKITFAFEDELIYESFSDVGEIRVYFASKILTPCRMH